MEDHIIIDRIEGKFAVCETGGDMVNIRLSLIEGKAREGDVLVPLSGDGKTGKFTVDREATDMLRAFVQTEFQKLLDFSESDRTDDK